MTSMNLKKLILNLIINVLLFVLMIITIQNSFQKKKVNFLNFQTIPLPLSFIIGSSLLTGSIIGSTLTNINKFKKD